MATDGLFREVRQGNVADEAMRCSGRERMESASDYDVTTKTTCPIYDVTIKKLLPSYPSRGA